MGLLSCNTIFQLDLFCKNEGKWSEIPYIQMFMALYQNRGLRKSSRMYIAITSGSDELEDTFLSVPARQRPLSLGDRTHPEGGAACPPAHPLLPPKVQLAPHNHSATREPLAPAPAYSPTTTSSRTHYHPNPSM